MTGSPFDYRKLFEHSPDPILVMRGDRFVDCNPAAARRMRFANRQELLDRFSGDFEGGSLRAHPAEFSPPFQSDGQPSLEKAGKMLEITHREGSHCFEWDHLTAEGELFTVEVMLTVIEPEPERLLLVVWRDITERKEREAKLREVQRLEALGRLAGGIAHDFNNLLMAILLTTDSAKEDLERRDSGETLKRLEEIDEVAQRASQLTRQLLAFSRGQPVQPRPVELVALLGSLAALLRRLIGSRHQLELHVPDPSIVVEVDPSQIEQLVVNLVVNARDAMPEGGRVDLSLAAEVSEGFAVIEVRDTGRGLAPDQVDRVFEPFFTTKSSGVGTGLGLATVRAIAEESGGSAHLKSVLGKGTRVQVRLPMSSARPSPRTSRLGTKARLEGATILLVEDEDRVRELVRRVLVKEGYRVRTAEDGVEALEVVSETSVDLVITDAVMPRMDGPELAERLQESHPDIEVLFLTGYLGKEKTPLARFGREVRVLEKPVSMRALLSVVAELLDRS